MTTDRKPLNKVSKWQGRLTSLEGEIRSRARVLSRMKNQDTQAFRSVYADLQRLLIARDECRTFLAEAEGQEQ